MYQLIQGDCIETMRGLEAGNVDAIITDLPYGTTQCAWDEIIPFEPMWEQVKRVLKPSGVFITTASQPFTSRLVASNLDWFRYEWIWEKGKATGHLDARRKPLKAHESVLVFAEKLPAYVPQMGSGKPYVNHHKPGDNGDVYGQVKHYSFQNSGTRFPRSIISFTHVQDPIHPTQKPVTLYSYLIRTYTNPGDTVADFCMGSGTTGVAAIKEGRNFIGGDNDPTYFAIAQKRIEETAAQPLLLEVI